MSEPNVTANFPCTFPCDSESGICGEMRDSKTHIPADDLGGCRHVYEYDQDAYAEACERVGERIIENRREARLRDVWTTDAPDGLAWTCPDCDSWATLGGNAGYHAQKSGHRLPTLQPIRKSDDPSATTLVLRQLRDWFAESMDCVQCREMDAVFDPKHGGLGICERHAARAIRIAQDNIEAIRNAARQVP